MQDNFTYDEMIEQLVRYADNELSEQESTQMAQMLNNDAALQERYENIINAKKTIRAAGLQQKVAALHNEYFAAIKNENKETKSTAKIIKPSFGAAKIILRIAAVFFIAFVGYGIFQFSTTSNDSVFENNFINYEVSVSRGEHNVTNIESLYKQQNYIGVTKTFEAEIIKTQEDYFLAALSYLKANNATAAINTFKALQQLNNTSDQKYYVQETDYYLALAYIKNGNIEEAQKQLSLITANKQHMFYDKANEISNVTLTILKWKN